jgi:uncharacterized SAM-binding protein YcdF (DUF218 family)
MSPSWLITNFIAAFLLPPLSLLLIAGAGLWYLRRRPLLGKTLIAFSLALLWLLATPVVADRLLALLDPVSQPITGAEADAIVILSGGTYANSVEYGGDTVNRFTLERIRYGAWLARRIGKPILVSGGAPMAGLAEGQLMRTVLESEFAVPVRWVEDRSLNTRENARFSAEILREAGIQRIFLVSHAWHLKRAVPEFEGEGLLVIPAGTDYFRHGTVLPMDWLPNAKALFNSYLAMHEGIGLIWYRIRN